MRRLYRKSLVSLRKAELKRLKTELTPEEYAALQPAIALLRKPKDYFTDEEKLVVESLFVLSQKLKKAYQFSRELTGIFDSYLTPEVVKEKMVQWVSSIINSELNCFNRFIRTLFNYQEEISNSLLRAIPVVLLRELIIRLKY